MVNVDCIGFNETLSTMAQESPYLKYDINDLSSPEHIFALADAAAQSFVLLSNPAGVLPLKPVRGFGTEQRFDSVQRLMLNQLVCSGDGVNDGILRADSG